MFKYEVDGRIFESSEEAVEYCFDEDSIDEDEYDDILNECYEEVDVCGYKYDPAYALKELDPIAYRCGFLDWQNQVYDERKEEYVWDVDNLDEGDTIDIEGLTVKCLFEEENDDNADENDDEGSERHGGYLVCDHA